MGITSQAVSKWECGLSYPDVTLLLPLAELFGITADEMLKGLGNAISVEKDVDVEEEQIKTISAGEAKQTENVSADTLENNDILKDDGVLRVVQCLGRRILRVDELNPDAVIHLSDVEASEVHILGNVVVHGNVEGNVKAGVEVKCEAVSGNVHAGADVNCDGIAGNVTAGCDVNCDEVGGKVTAGCDVNCDEVGGNASAGVNITASCIKGDAKAGGKIIYNFNN